MATAERDAILPDGTAITIRALRSDDREKLAAAYELLSAPSRQTRFFSAPKRLTEAMLDYLTTTDQDHHLALTAVLRTGDEELGLGVARWVRDVEHPTNAEVAITVADDHQRRGIGTELLRALVEEAVTRGITTFTGDVLWDNGAILDPLRALHASIKPGEPGVAHVAIDLPVTPRDWEQSTVRRSFATVAAEGSATQ